MLAGPRLLQPFEKACQIQTYHLYVRLRNLIVLRAWVLPEVFWTESESEMMGGVNIV